LSKDQRLRDKCLRAGIDSHRRQPGGREAGLLNLQRIRSRSESRELEETILADFPLEGDALQIGDDLQVCSACYQESQPRDALTVDAASFDSHPARDRGAALEHERAKRQRFAGRNLDTPPVLRRQARG
jgi:hypothetical protein